MQVSPPCKKRELHCVQNGAWEEAERTLQLYKAKPVPIPASGRSPTVHGAGREPHSTQSGTQGLDGAEGTPWLHKVVQILIPAWSPSVHRVVTDQVGVQGSSGLSAASGSRTERPSQQAREPPQPTYQERDKLSPPKLLGVVNYLGRGLQLQGGGRDKVSTGPSPFGDKREAPHRGWGGVVVDPFVAGRS